MTRTLLNWSELLDVYRGKGLKINSGLKKWSEMDKSGSTKKKRIVFDHDITHIPHQKYITSEESILNRNSVSTEPIDLGVSQVSSGTANTDRVLVRTKIRNLNLDNSPSQPEDLSVEHEKILIPTRKSPEELLYDLAFQDKNSIPKLYSSQQAQQKQKILTERENLLLDILEMNKDLYQNH
jgi:hypothetical protein